MSANSKNWSLLSTAVGLAFSLSASAQSSRDSEDNAATATSLEEVIVTARRREESIQDVPLSLLVFSDEEIALAGLRELEDVNVMVPNLSVNAGFIRGEFNTIAVMRGIPGVAIYIDGIETTRNNLLTREFVELERIEVLKGPQGTLFGRGTMGGAVQFITKVPADEFEAKIQATAGSFNRADLKATASFRLGDAFKVRLTGAHAQRDGYVKNILPGGVDSGDLDDQNLRADFYFEPNETFDARYSWDRVTFERNGVARVLHSLLPPPPGFPFTLITMYDMFGFPPVAEATDYSTSAGIGEWNIASSKMVSGADTHDLDQHSLTLSWDVNEAIQIRSLTGYRTSGSRNYGETDGTRYQVFDEINYVDGETFSQEIQLLGSTNQLRWVAGYYHRESDNRDRRVLFAQKELKENPAILNRVLKARLGRLLVPPLENIFGAREEQTEAFFGELTWSATNRLGLTLGLRRNTDDNVTRRIRAALQAGADFSATTVTLHPVSEAVSGSTIPNSENPSKFSSTTGRVSLQYNFSDQATTYLNYSEGFGAGAAGIATNPQLPAPQPWIQDPMEIGMFEWGVKSNLVDNSLRLNAAVFSGKWDKIQLSNTFIDPETGAELPVVIPTNAGEARVDGLEVDLSYVPNESFLINLNLGFTDARYTEVGRATLIDKNSKFRNTPELSWSGSAQYNWELANGVGVTARINYGWVGDYYTETFDNRQLKQDAYGLLSARLIFETPSENIRIMAFGDNLSNEYYLTGGGVGGPVGTLLNFAGRPREYGVMVDVFF